MIFEDEYSIIYCQDNYQEKFDNGDYYFDQDSAYRYYYRGYLVHREDGPAIEWYDGDKWWFISGKPYTEKEYWKLMNLKNKSRVLNDI